MSMNQIELDYEGSLIDQFPTWRQVVVASVYGCGKQFKNVAADLDMSETELSRRLNDNPKDTLKFILFRLDELIAATDDLRPVYWLIEKFCEDQETRQRRVVSQLEKAVPQITQLLKALKQ